MSPKGRLVLVTSLLALAGCDTLFGKKKDPLQGSREPVFISNENVNPDVEPGTHEVKLPKAESIAHWPQASGTPHHVVPTAKLGEVGAEPAWTRDVGRGAGSDRRLMAGPVSAEGIVYTIDSVSRISAVSLEDGKVVWEQDVSAKEGEHPSFGGGVAVENGIVFAGTAAAEAYALNAKTGEILWSQRVAGPVRTAPVVKNGRLYLVTLNNQLECMDAKTGEALWTHSGIIESAGLLGSATPAVGDDIVVVAYSSGEVYALKTSNGHTLWSQSINPARRLDPVSSLSHIKARPILDGNKVYLVSHGGRMEALEVRTGKPVWSRDVGGIRTPAVVGNYLFMVSGENRLICMLKQSGKVIWSKQLPRYENEEKSKNPLLWAGPIAVNSHLVLAANHGQAIFVRAKDGHMERQITLPSGTSLSPITAAGYLIFLTDSANLVAYRERN